MPQSKRFDNYSLEELEAIIKSSKEDTRVLNEAEDFILRYNIREGGIKIQPSLFYVLYKERTEKPIGFLKFIRQSNKIFKKKCGNGERCYDLDLSSLTDFDLLEKIRLRGKIRTRRSNENKKREKRNKEKQS